MDCLKKARKESLFIRNPDLHERFTNFDLLNQGETNLELVILLRSEMRARFHHQ